MNRLWHWNQAEEHLALAEESYDEDRERCHLARAQVHATLAASPQECPIDPSFLVDE